jgi:general secretion pathway protein C
MRRIYLFLARIFAPLLNLALAAVLGYQSTTAVLAWYAPLPPLPPVPVTIARATPLPPARVDSARLAAAHLFGQPSPSPVVARAPTTAPATKLDLRLKGVLADSEGRGLALIRLPTGESKVFSIGQGVSGNIALHSIYADKVLLARNGQYETLRLEGKDPEKQLVTRQPDAAPLRDYRQEILRKPEDIGRYLRLRPARQGDLFIGYSLYPGKEVDILNELGLQAGDIVTAVNGTVLDSPLKGLDILQQLAQAQSVNLEILRNGSKVSLNVALP